MKEADMMKKICPIMSPAPRALVDDMFILCQGSACLAFGSNPTTVFLAEDGETTTFFQKKKRFYEAASHSSPIHDREDESEKFDTIIAKGWKKEGSGVGVHFTRKGEPNCWCDAMAGNAACGYEAP